MAWNIRTSRQFSPDLEILVHQVNVDVAASIVIDASTVAPDPITGERKLLAGTPMVKNVNNQYQAYQAAASFVNQTAVVDATGGAWQLTHSANATAAMDWDASAAEVEAELEGLASITDVEVSRAPRVGNAYKYTITFVDEDEASAITAAPADTLTGGLGTVVIASALGSIMGILARSEVFPDGTSKSDLPSAIWNHGQWFRSDRIVGWATDQAAIKAALPTCKFS
jgi:hypothetical protein